MEITSDLLHLTTKSLDKPSLEFRDARKVDLVNLVKRAEVLGCPHFSSSDTADLDKGEHIVIVGSRVIFCVNNLRDFKFPIFTLTPFNSTLTPFNSIKVIDRMRIRAKSLLSAFCNLNADVVELDNLIVDDVTVFNECFRLCNIKKLVINNWDLSSATRIGGFINTCNIDSLYMSNIKFPDNVSSVSGSNILAYVNINKLFINNVNITEELAEKFSGNTVISELETDNDIIRNSVGK